MIDGARSPLRAPRPRRTRSTLGAAAALALLAALEAPPAAATTSAGPSSIVADAPERAYVEARRALRELYWAEMAAFFEAAPEEATPAPRDDPESAPAPLPLQAALADLPAASRSLLAELAAQDHVDRLDDTRLHRLARALARATPDQVERLLRAPSPTLRAYVWTWLAHSDAGLALLPALAPATFDAALADRSVAVEHGDDLIFRALADYALEARVRLGSPPERPLAPVLQDILASDRPALVRAAALGVLARRGEDLDPLAHLHDPAPAVRVAAAAAALERGVPPAHLVDLAAADPDDRVTEAIVAELLVRAARGRRARPGEARSAAAIEALDASSSPRIQGALQRARGEAEAPARLPPPPGTEAPAPPEPTTEPAPSQLAPSPTVDLVSVL